MEGLSWTCVAIVEPSDSLAGLRSHARCMQSRPCIRHRDASFRQNSTIHNQNRDAKDVRILKSPVPDDVYHIDLTNAEHTLDHLLGFIAKWTISLRIQTYKNGRRASRKSHSHRQLAGPNGRDETGTVICAYNSIMLYFRALARAKRRSGGIGRRATFRA